jgi:NifB/MoaA-like Fe-S oxidoreductase
MREKLGTTFAFLGDEIYLRAGRGVPSRRHYGDYPQIEDGIGMVRAFANDFAALRRRLERRQLKQQPVLPINATIMTGTLFAPVLKRLTDTLNARFGTSLHVAVVENQYFGGDVSVAGLLTGGCFLAAREQVRGDFVIIPRPAVKSDEPIMLDGMTLTDLEQRLGLPVRPLDFASFTRLFSSSS